MANEIIRPDTSALAVLQAGEIDQQVATARRFPRDEVGFSRKLEHFVTIDDETAAECTYTLPRGGKDITGPSVRFAEIAAPLWGNARYQARVVDEDERFLTAQAYFHDLQSNTAISLEVKRQIWTSDREGNGRRYSLDMIQTTGQAAMKIALRNVILTGIGPFWRGAYAKSMAAIVGTFETIGKRRATAIEQYKRIGVSESLVLELLGVKRLEDVEPNHMLLLRGTLIAIRDGETTVERTFGTLPSQRGQSAPKSDIAGKLDAGKAAHAAEVAKDAAPKPQADAPAAKVADAKPKAADKAPAAPKASAKLPPDVDLMVAAFGRATSHDELSKLLKAHHGMIETLGGDVKDRATTAYNAAQARINAAEKADAVKPREGVEIIEQRDVVAEDAGDIGDPGPDDGDREVWDEAPQASSEPVDGKDAAPAIQTGGERVDPAAGAPTGQEGGDDIDLSAFGEKDRKYFTKVQEKFRAASTIVEYRDAIEFYRGPLTYKTDPIKAGFAKIQAIHAARLGAPIDGKKG